MSNYVKKTLLHNEKIVYEARMHRFCYLGSIVMIILGLLLADIYSPKIPDQVVKSKQAKNIEKTLEDLSYNVESLTYKIQEYFKDTLGVIPDEVKNISVIFAKLRQTYIGVILLFLGFTNLLRVYLKKNTSEFVVTSLRVIYKYGFISIDTNEIKLENIEGVKVKQSPMDRIVNRGDVIISGNGFEQIEMLQLANPAKFKQAILNTFERVRAGSAPKAH